MNATLQRMLADLQALSLPERAELAQACLESLAPGEELSEPEADALWRAELSRRDERRRDGEVTGVPAEDVYARIRAEILAPRESPAEGQP